jgi:hypothetical protein
MLKGFFSSFGCSSFYFHNENKRLFYDFRWYFLSSQSLQGFEIYKIFLLIGTNLRLEAPLINSRLRKSYLNDNINFKIYSIGFSDSLSRYPIISLGCSIKALLNYSYGISKFIKLIIGKSYSTNILLVNYICSIKLKKINIIFGLASINQFGYFIFWNILKSLKYFNLDLNILIDYLGRLTFLELGFGKYKYKYKNSFNFIYNCHCFIKNDNFFSIYQGSFFQENFGFNLYLPVLFPIERFGSYLNLEGRYRFTKKVIKLNNYTYTDWEIFQLLIWIKSQFTNFENFSIIEFFYIYVNIFSKLINYKCSFFYSFNNLNKRYKYLISLSPFKTIYTFYIHLNWGLYIFKSVFSRLITNYYLINNIIPSSKILALCSRQAWLKW